MLLDQQASAVAYTEIISVLAVIIACPIPLVAIHAALTQNAWRITAGALAS